MAMKWNLVIPYVFIIGLLGGLIFHFLGIIPWGGFLILICVAPSLFKYNKYFWKD